MASEIPKASSQEWQCVLEKLIIFTQASEELVSSLKSALIGDHAQKEVVDTTAASTADKEPKGVCWCKSSTKIPKQPLPTTQSTESANEKPSTDSVKLKPKEKAEPIQKRPSKHKSPKKVRSKSSDVQVDTSRQIVKLNTIQTNLKNIQVEISKVLERLKDLEKCIKGGDERTNSPEYSVASNMFRQILNETNELDRGFLQEANSEISCGPCQIHPNASRPQQRNLTMSPRRNVDISAMLNQGMMGFPSPGRMQSPIPQQPMRQMQQLSIPSGCRPCTPRQQSPGNVSDSIMNQRFIERSQNSNGGCGPCSRTQ